MQAMYIGLQVIQQLGHYLQVLVRRLYSHQSYTFIKNHNHNNKQQQHQNYSNVKIVNFKTKNFLQFSFPTDICNLSDNIYDYFNVSQGKVTIPSMDDGEEFSLTDVSVFTMFRMQRFVNHQFEIRLFIYFEFCCLFSITQLNVDKKIYQKLVFFLFPVFHLQ